MSDVLTIAEIETKFQSDSASYGPNSSQYEQSGGTREDERKPRQPGSSKKSSTESKT